MFYLYPSYISYPDTQVQVHIFIISIAIFVELKRSFSLLCVLKSYKLVFREKNSQPIKYSLLLETIK